MKKKFLTLSIFLLCAVSAVAQQQRLIVFGGAPWFAFDPIGDRYARGSLAQVAEYVDAWRAELYDENVFVAVADNFGKTQPAGYKMFTAATDSTVLKKALGYLKVQQIDTVCFKFEHKMLDTLSGRWILVVDRWDFLGDVKCESKTVDIGDFPQSKRFLDLMDGDVQAVKRRMSTPVTVLDTAYTSTDICFGASRLGNLMADYQQNATGAEISIVTPPRQRLTWSAGDLYLKDIASMFPYDNSLVTIELTGSQLLAFMEEVYGGRFYTMRRPTDDLVNIRTPYFLHDEIVGIVHTVNLTKPRGKRIENHDIDLAKRYTLSLSAFRAKWFLENGILRLDQIKDCGEYRVGLVKHLINNKLETKLKPKLYTITPERWVQEATDREREKIFK